MVQEGESDKRRRGVFWDQRWEGLWSLKARSLRGWGPEAPAWGKEAGAGVEEMPSS